MKKIGWIMLIFGILLTIGWIIMLIILAINGSKIAGVALGILIGLAIIALILKGADLIENE